MRRTHFYDDQEFDYQSFWRKRQYENYCEEEILRIFFKKIAKKKNLKKCRLLDIGAGFGRLGRFYLPQVKRAVLLDPAHGQLEKAKRNLKRFKNFKTLNQTIEDVKLKQNNQDIILMIRVIHHLKSPKKALRTVKRSLKPGGFFILEYPNKLHIKRLFNLTFRGKIQEIFSLKRIDRRSQASLKKRSIPFYNYHPLWIRKTLKKQGFKVLKTYSASNCRMPGLKKLIPIKLILWLERITRPLFSLFVFGPSIFVLCVFRKN